LGLLSGERDHHHGTPRPSGLDEHGFIAWLDALQADWVTAARRMSPRLVTDLLAWTGPQVDETLARQDPGALTAHVSWAGPDAVPQWLHHARELSERWIHRQQLLEAVGRPADLRADVDVPVLDGLRWAYPFRLGAAPRPPGTRVVVAITGPEVTVTWELTCDGRVWLFAPPTEYQTAPTRLVLTTDQAWRLLTNNLRPDEHGTPSTDGDSEIATILLRTRAIIGEPH
jgi:hypothetical protein